MQITRIELKDVKSYAEATVEFAAGTNAICGENGAGKSTLLEAIGFTLFGYSPGRDNKQFVRQGMQSGSATVAFIAGDDCEYEVVRQFGEKSAYYAYHPALDHKLTEGKADTMAWLCQHLGVPANTDLASLFSDAIGVPQGLLSAVFLEGASERRNKFERLLRVDEYRRAREELREAEKRLGEQLAEARVRLKELQTRVERRPAIEQELARLDQEIGEDHAGERRLAEQISAGQTRLTEMEAAKARIERLSQQLGLLGERAGLMRRQISDSQRSLDQARRAAEEMARAAAGHRAYADAQTALEELEAARAKRDGLRAEWNRAQRSLDAVAQRLASGRQRLEEIAHAEARLAELTPLVRQQESAEQALAGAQARAVRLAECQNAAKREAGRMAETDTEIAELEGGIAGIERQRATAERQPALKAALDTLLAEVAEARAELGQAQKSRRAVEGGACPFLGEACHNMAEGVSLAAFFDAQIASWRSKLSGLDAQHKRADAALAGANAALSQLAALPELEVQRRRRLAARDEISSRLAAWQTEAASIADAPERILAAQEQLRALGDHRPAYAVARAAAGKRAEIAAALESDEVERARRAAELGGLEKRLAEHAELDAHVEARRQELRRHEADHQAYLRSEASAASVPAREQALAQQQQELTVLDAQAAAAESQLREARAGYDAGEHARLDASQRQAQAHLASLQERLRLNVGLRASRQAELEQLLALEAELGILQGRYQEDEDLLGFIQYTRNVMNEAGPLVTRALVGDISRQAGEIFAEIMHDHTQHLYWNEEFEITVEKTGLSRTFRQLSGGEQMAAAIAVRLALLRRVSSIDIAFFDEPTANLDETRRANLADQIVGVRGFSQIFVISHDDTFERVTDHTVRVFKENGLSRVESQ